MEHSALIDLVSIVILGIMAQWIAWRLRMPSILLLLVFGFLAGPVTGFLHPDKLLGHLLFPFVSISVALILFEGGLSLRIAELENIGRVVSHLILIGVPVTLVASAWGAWWLLDMKPSLALLLGAILVVTGPTVILPILRSLRLSERVSSLLKWEAMLNDPVGAILAVLVFEAILVGGFQEATSRTAFMLAKSLLVGSGLGFLAAWSLVFLLKRYMIPDFLHSAFALMVVVLVFSLSNFIQAESGLIAVTMAGFFLANQKKTPVKHIVEFKENLRVLLISTLFIILAARLELEYLTHIGLSEIGFLAFLFFIVRPLAIFLSSWGGNLGWRDKLFISWMAPRGIVAAAVASVFAIRLETAGYPDAEKMVALVFLVIITTVTVYGITAPWVAKWLDIARPSPKGVLFLGAHLWARKMARALQDEGFQVLLVDTNRNNVYEAHLSLLPAVRGNILSDELVEELDLNGIGRLMALTPNDDVNALACSHFAETFERSEVYQLFEESHEKKRQVQKTAKRAHGRFLFKKGMTFRKLNDLFQRKGQVHKITLTREYNYEAFQREYANRSLSLFLVTETGDLKVVTASGAPEPKSGQTLIVLTYQP